MIHWPTWRLAVALVLAAVIGGHIWELILLIREEIEDRQRMRELQEAAENEHDSCEGCRWNLGGGCCSLNVEDECGAGGGYELWEGKEDE